MSPSRPCLRLVPDAESTPMRTPSSDPASPRHLRVAGVDAVGVLPPAPAPLRRSATPAPSSPEPETSSLDAAVRGVATVARAVSEVLSGRRPASHLDALVDDRSAALLAAWARLGRLRGVQPGMPHLSQVTADRLEGWVPFRLPDAPTATAREARAGRTLAAVAVVERVGGRWRCTRFQLLAPDEIARAAA